MALDEVLAPQVRRYLLQHPELVAAPFELTLLAAGEYNLNYLVQGAGRRVVVRLSTGSQEVAAGAQQVVYEANALRLLEPSGVAPRLFHVDAAPDGLPFGLLVEEYLPGRPLDYANPDDLRRAAATLARLHAFRLGPAPPGGTTLLSVERPLTTYLGFGRDMLAHYRAAPDASGEVLEILAAVERSLSRATPLEGELFPPGERGVVHTDVQAHNFILEPVALDGIGPPRTRLVDWEKPMLDDPTYDLCHFLAPPTTRWKCGVTLDAPAGAAFLAAYAAARSAAGAPTAGGLAALERRRRLRQPFVHWRAITWCAMAWVEYRRPDRPLRHVDTWERIVGFLAPEFLRALFAPVLRREAGSGEAPWL